MIPDTLYNYQPWQGNYKRSLTNFEVYFSKPKNFNDPFDSATPYCFDPKQMTEENITKYLYQVGRRQEKEERTNEYLEAHIKKNDLRNKLKNGEFNRIGIDVVFENVNNIFGVFCLTKKNDHPLMWSHYGNKHAGICIGYNSKALIETLNGGWLRKVKYSTNYPYTDMFNEDPDKLLNIVTTKSAIWRYESEYRFIKVFAGNKAFQIPPSAIKEIVFGCNISEQDIEEIGNFIKEQKHIKFLAAVRSAKNYTLEIKPLN
jgi:hypothetical protein